MAAEKSMKRILVTGGNKGIGKAICERLLTEWDDTSVILCSRDKTRGEEAIESIQKSLGLTKVKNRLELLVLDTSSSQSVQEAAETFSSSSEKAELYGIINNAGIYSQSSSKDTINTNYFGPRRVNDAFKQFLQRPGGRIVNVGSAAGPYYLQTLPNSSDIKEKLTKPWLLTGGIKDIDEIATELANAKAPIDAYGQSKALLHAYTAVHAKLEPELFINAVTPGYIKTDITAGSGATNPPSKGAEPPCWLMMDAEFVPKQPQGRYYGSDCVRSPLHYYRDPGTSPYVDDDDLAELPLSATETLTQKV